MEDEGEKWEANKEREEVTFRRKTRRKVDHCGKRERQA